MKIIIEIPHQCPSCASTLTRIKDQLFCTNANCNDVTIKRIASFTKVMKIKGLGQKSIEKLGITSISEIYQLSLLDISNILGDKLATKLFSEITKSKVTTLSTLLAALSIPLIGATAGNKVNEVFTQIGEINSVGCKRAGLGDKATSSLLTWLKLNDDLVSSLPISTKATSIKPTKNKVVCISGKLISYPSKAKATILLESLGYSLASSMSKKVDYLINEDNKESSKVLLAKKYGIDILTIEELKGKQAT